MTASTNLILVALLGSILCVSCQWTTTPTYSFTGNARYWNTFWYQPSAEAYYGGTCSTADSYNSSYIAYQVMFPASGAQEIVISLSDYLYDDSEVYVYSTAAFNPSTPCVGLLTQLYASYSLDGGPDYNTYFWFQANVSYTIVMSSYSIIETYTSDYTFTDEGVYGLETYATWSGLTNQTGVWYPVYDAYDYTTLTIQHDCTTDDFLAPFTTWTWTQTATAWMDVIVGVFNNSNDYTEIYFTLYQGIPNKTGMYYDGCNNTATGATLLKAHYTDETSLYLPYMQFTGGVTYSIAVSGGSIGGTTYDTIAAPAYYAIQVVPTRSVFLQGSGFILPELEHTYKGGCEEYTDTVDEKTPWNVISFVSQSNYFIMTGGFSLYLEVDIFEPYLLAYTGNNSGNALQAAPYSCGGIGEYYIGYGVAESGGFGFATSVGSTYSIVIATYAYDDTSKELSAGVTLYAMSGISNPNKTTLGKPPGSGATTGATGTGATGTVATGTTGTKTGTTATVSGTTAKTSTLASTLASTITTSDASVAYAPTIVMIVLALIALVL